MRSGVVFGWRIQVQEAMSNGVQRAHDLPVLVAVSKYKPVEDILACYEYEQRDFGENYVNELVEKASQLPADARWHFIGTLQSNKCKTLAAIPNLYAIQTLDSAKKATSLQKGLPQNRTEPLNVSIQVNTSGEEAKSGLPPLSPSQENLHKTEVVALAIHILENCPLLRLRGLMTIGSIEQSHASDNEPNRDFETLVNTAAMLESILNDRVAEAGRWGGPDGKLELSMGMSTDFESAIQAGAGAVRVGTGIFGARKTKEEIKQQ